MIARSLPVGVHLHDRIEPPKPEPLPEPWRCPHCRRLLLEITCEQGSRVAIRTVCPKCRETVTLEKAA